MHRPDSDEVIFNAARQFTDPEKRARYLALACEGNPSLHARIERLLGGAAEADAFFGRNAAFAAEVLSPAVELAPAPPAAPVVEQPGAQIGRYKLLQTIGEGGCGIVY